MDGENSLAGARAPQTSLRSKTAVITGAFSFTGRYATRLLIQRGWRMRTLTSHRADASPFPCEVPSHPYCFEDPSALRRFLEGADVLLNTYWVRFPRGEITHERAVHNSLALFRAAKQAGIARIVHVSIANASRASPLSYYSGKARVEKALEGLGLTYAILRPTVIFGKGDILINNIAWFVRRLPLFGIPGNGQYGVQPIFVEDMAQLLADAAERTENYAIDAVGPETYAFEKLVKEIAKNVGRPGRTVRIPARLAFLCTNVAGWVLRDTVLTWEEYRGLMANLLVSGGPATGTTRLSEWLRANGSSLGRAYASEVARHFRKSRE
jgi:NADH dehydrogenase